MKNLSIPSLLLLSTALSLQAAVDLWDGTANNVVTGNQAFAGGITAAAATQTGSKAYSLATSMLAGNANYTGPALFGGAFGFAEDDVAAGGVPIGIARNDTPEVIRFQSPLADADVSLTLRGAVLLSTAPIGSNLSFATITGLSLSARYQLATAAGIEMRWLAVGNGGTTYVSSVTLSTLTSTYADYSLASTLSTNWAAWAPGADMSLGSLTYNVAGNSISNITHVGYYLNVETSGANSQRTIDMTTFTAVTVPEPTTFALLAGFMALGLILWRRRRV